MNKERERYRGTRRSKNITGCILDEQEDKEMLEGSILDIPGC